MGSLFLFFSRLEIGDGFGNGVCSAGPLLLLWLSSSFSLLFSSTQKTHLLRPGSSPLPYSCAHAARPKLFLIFFSCCIWQCFFLFSAWDFDRVEEKRIRAGWGVTRGHWSKLCVLVFLLVVWWVDGWIWVTKRKTSWDRVWGSVFLCAVTCSFVCRSYVSCVEL